VPEANTPLINRLFDDGGDLLRAASSRQPKEYVHTLAIDSDQVFMREDSFQITALKGEMFEIQGVYVDGAQVWRYQKELLDAGRNITSIYGTESGPAKIVRPLFDRSLAERLSLHERTPNRALRARIKIDLQGEVHSYEFDTVLATVQPINRRQCGRMIATRKRGREVLDAVTAARNHFNFGGMVFSLDPRDQDEHHRISTDTQNILANLVASTYATHAQRERLPWIYRATNQAGEFYRADRPLGHSFYAVDAIPHKFTSDYYCKISPAFRELVALLTQSLAQFYMAGGKPDQVNQRVLRKLVKSINVKYDKLKQTTEGLETKRKLIAA
jgi:hypothetical protein